MSGLDDVVVAPSILSADYMRLGAEIAEVMACGVDWVHVDVMDGHFVPNISYGPAAAKGIRKSLPQAKLDCHLMCTNPRKWLKDFAGACDQFTFHIEAPEEQDPAGLCREIRQLGIRPSVCLKPKTPVETIKALLDEGLVDNVLILSVEPGFGGQKFMPEVLSKVRYIAHHYPRVTIELDGGIDATNIRQCYDAGARWFVAGSSVFGPADRRQAIAALRQA